MAEGEKVPGFYAKPCGSQKRTLWACNCGVSDKSVAVLQRGLWGVEMGQSAVRMRFNKRGSGGHGRCVDRECLRHGGRMRAL